MLELIERIGDVKSTGIDTSEILDNLILPYELRIRGRLRATTETNVDVGLFLDRGPVLRDGDLLQARTGEIVRIRAAEEQVVTARIKSGQPLARLCYHLGNRHVKVQVGPRSLRILPDHVLEEMLVLLGLTLQHAHHVFVPEQGAYTGHGGHSHSHQQPLAPPNNKAGSIEALDISGKHEHH